MQQGFPPSARNINLIRVLNVLKDAAELKGAIDLGLTGALALNCALGQI
jgi:hypothetical protein